MRRFAGRGASAEWEDRYEDWPDCRIDPGGERGVRASRGPCRSPETGPGRGLQASRTFQADERIRPSRRVQHEGRRRQPELERQSELEWQPELERQPELESASRVVAAALREPPSGEAALRAAALLALSLS